MLEMINTRKLYMQNHSFTLIGSFHLVSENGLTFQKQHDNWAP